MSGARLAHGATTLAVIIALGAMIGFYRDQARQLTAARDGLAQQAAATASAERQLDALATGTANLAAKGNLNAQGVLETLKRNGINVKAKR